MRIRLAAPTDNEALCRMELLAPQGTSVRLTENRRDYFARANLFPGSILLLAEDERRGQLVGVFGGAPVRLRFGGEERLGGYLFDFRANPERRTGLSRVIYALWQEMEAGLRAAGVQFMYGLVKDDNPAVSIYTRMDAHRQAGRTFWTLPVYRRRPVPPGVTADVRIDSAAERRAMAGWFQGHDLWPILDDQDYLETVDRRFLRARLSHEGASLKIWDNTFESERVVTAISWYYKAAAPVADLIRPLLPLPRIPRVGRPIRTWYVYDVCLPPGSKSLPGLLAAANNLALEAGVDFLIFTGCEGEPALAVGGRGSLITLHYSLMIKPYETLPRVRPPVYLDPRIF